MPEGIPVLFATVIAGTNPACKIRVNLTLCS